MFDRIRFGRVVEEGQLDSEQRREYKKLFSMCNSVEVRLNHSYCAIPWSRYVPYVNNPKKRTLNGSEAWESMESEFEKMTKTPLDEIPLFFKHRQKKEKNFVEMGASAGTMLGSRHVYNARISSN